MKIEIRKSCDIGEIFDEYYGCENKKKANCEIEVAFTFPLELLQEEEEAKKESASFREKADSELMEILKNAAAKMVEEIIVSTEQLNY